MFILKNLLKKSLIYIFYVKTKKILIGLKSNLKKIIIFNFRSIKGSASKYFMLLLSSTEFITYNFNFFINHEVHDIDKRI